MGTAAASARTAGSRDDWHAGRALRVAVALLCALALFSALLPLYRAQFLFEININEGWNAYHADAAAAGGTLYPAPDQLITNNYPPLSYYLLAALAPLLGGPLFAGRAVSFIALCVVAAALYAMLRVLGVRRLFAVAAAASYFGVTCRLFMQHPAVNDPQLLADAIASVGFLWFLQNWWRGGGHFLGPAAVMVCAVFTKQNVLAFPFTAFAVLCLEDRKGALRFAATGIVLAAGGLLFSRWLFGPAFLFNLFSPRPYELANSLKVIEDFHRIAPAVIAWGLYAAQGRDGRRARMVTVLCASALLEGMVVRGAKEVHYNAEFDFVIAVHLALGLALERLPAFALARRFGADRLRVALIAACALRLLVAELTERENLLSPTYRDQLRQAERITRAEAERVAALPGPVFCDITLICYLAGKPFAVDPVNVPLRIESGALPADIVARKLAAGELTYAPALPGALLRR